MMLTENPVVNVPLMRKTLEHVTLHPEEHRQHLWLRRTPCGTVGCFAGHAVIFAGHEIDWGIANLYGELDVTKAGDTIFVVARRELGLTVDDAESMFYGGNGIDDLWRLAELFTNGEIKMSERPDPPRG